jgi:transposase-like protein
MTAERTSLQQAKARPITRVAGLTDFVLTASKGNKVSASPSPDQITMDSLDTLFPNDKACFSYLAEVRFGRVPRCPHCCRETQFHRNRSRWFVCRNCKRYLLPTSGTIFFDSRICLRLWFQCALLMSISSVGVSSRFVARFLGISHRTAWRMTSSFRRQIAQLAYDGMFGGRGQHVQIDETLVKYAREQNTKALQKAVVFGISDGHSVWTCLIKNRSRQELGPIIRRKIRAETIVDTDGLSTYSNLAKIGYGHRVVNHSSGFWVGPDGANTMHIDCYWAYLKRTLGRTYIGVGAQNLNLYLKEIEVRFNHRSDPTALFWKLLSCHSPYPVVEATL